MLEEGASVLRSSRRVPPLWVRFLKRPLPRGLFGRTLLIVVVPTLLALCVATFVFFDRHWETVTRRLSSAVAGDIALVVEQMRAAPNAAAKADVVFLADKKMSLYISFAPGETLPSQDDLFLSPMGDLLRDALDFYVPYPSRVNLKHAPSVIAVEVGAPDGVYTFLMPEKRIYTPTTEVFIGWMIGSSILLSAIALLFMRNQIRPILRLADAAEAMGKGQDVPWYNPEGAVEVRQAGTALLLMRDRLKRQISQRTAMLAGVSHDLRTPLTRMKLQIALMPSSPETQEFEADIAEMEGMLEAYLAFARGDEGEAVSDVDLEAVLEEVVAGAKRQNGQVSLSVQGGPFLRLRRNAIKRCLSNLVGNALRYGKKADVRLAFLQGVAEVSVDDDGPGIPAARREEVFRPFLRLDESRNPVTGGVGLGLTIARDIARAHGGDIILEDSPLGGLRARLRLPV